MGYTFKVEGLDKLQKKLKKNIALDFVKQTVRVNGAALTTKIVKNADFKGHYEGRKFKYPTGATKRSIGESSPHFLDGGLTVEAGATTEYAEYVERGTRFMDAQPFVKPAFEEQKKQFKRDIEELMK